MEEATCEAGHTKEPMQGSARSPIRSPKLAQEEKERVLHGTKSRMSAGPGNKSLLTFCLSRTYPETSTHGSVLPCLPTRPATEKIATSEPVGKDGAQSCCKPHPRPAPDKVLTVEKA